MPALKLNELSWVGRFAASLVLIPQRECLQGEGRGDRVDVGKPAPTLTAKIKAAVGARVAGANLELFQGGSFPSGGFPVERGNPGPVGVKADAEQLGVDVGSL